MTTDFGGASKGQLAHQWVAGELVTNVFSATGND